jgi:hypothetical protein
VDFDQFAVVVDRLAGPKAHDCLERLVEHQRALDGVENLAVKRAEFPSAVVTEANADDQPARRQLVERRALPSEHPRSAPS